MLVIIPLIGLFLLYLIWLQRGKPWRESVLLSTIAFALLITASTEVLSLFSLINTTAIAAFWSITCIVLAWLYYQQRQQVKSKKSKYYSEPLIANNNFKYKSNTSNTIIASLPELEIAKSHSRLSSISKLFLGSIGVIVAVVGAVATIAPPNNWDSMTYHMTRIMHWMQNGSIAHYPTNYPPQLYHPPFAEYAIMHLQILSGGDRLANLVQWLAMVGSIVATSLIAKQLGANQRGQIFTAVITATIPMGILQGSSTLNDYVVAFWLTCVVYYILVAITEGFTQGNDFKIAASFGLGMFTKTTASLFAFPFLVWLFYVGLKRLGWKIWQ
ncbi:MAG: glycosyltransferase family 39 protein [Pleurocapsa sp.]